MSKRKASSFSDPPEEPDSPQEDFPDLSDLPDTQDEFYAGLPEYTGLDNFSDLPDIAGIPPGHNAGTAVAGVQSAVQVPGSSSDMNLAAKKLPHENMSPADQKKLKKKLSSKRLREKKNDEMNELGTQQMDLEKKSNQLANEIESLQMTKDEKTERHNKMRSHLKMLEEQKNLVALQIKESETNYSSNLLSGVVQNRRPAGMLPSGVPQNFALNQQPNSGPFAISQQPGGLSSAGWFAATSDEQYMHPPASQVQRYAPPNPQLQQVLHSVPPWAPFGQGLMVPPQQAINEAPYLGMQQPLNPQQPPLVINDEPPQPHDAAARQEEDPEYLP